TKNCLLLTLNSSNIYGLTEIMGEVCENVLMRLGAFVITSIELAVVWLGYSLRSFLRYEKNTVKVLAPFSYCDQIDLEKWIVDSDTTIACFLMLPILACLGTLIASICTCKEKHNEWLLLGLAFLLWYPFFIYMYIAIMHYFIMICTDIRYYFNGMLYIFLISAVSTCTIKILIISVCVVTSIRDIKKCKCSSCTALFVYFAWLVAYILTVVFFALSLAMPLNEPTKLLENWNKTELYFVKKGAFNDQTEYKVANNISMDADWYDSAYIVNSSQVLYISALEKFNDKNKTHYIVCGGVIKLMPKHFDDKLDYHIITLFLQIIKRKNQHYFIKPIIQYNIQIASTTRKTATGKEPIFRYRNMSDMGYELHLLVHERNSTLGKNKDGIILYRPPSDQFRLLNRNFTSCDKINADNLDQLDFSLSDDIW
ncbi:unnamed protein product, partial [Owenia fusiformis]